MKPATIAAGILLCAFDAASQVPPAEPNARIEDLVKVRRFSEAEQAITEKLLEKPEWEKGHLLLAQIYTQAGRYGAAERSASAALHIRQSVDGLLLLAVALRHQNRLNDAIASLEQAARLQPDQAEIYNVLGTVYTLGSWAQEAEKAFAQAVRLAAWNWEYRYAHGRTLFELGRYHQALPELARAVELNGSSVKAWTALGQVQERFEQNNRSEESYRKALELCAGAECSWPWLQLGYRYTRENKFKEALSYYRKAMQARPEWAAPHYHVGKTLAQLDELDGARAELEKALALDSSKPEYHYHLAHIYRRLGETEKATTEFARFRSLVQRERTSPQPESAGP